MSNKAKVITRAAGRIERNSEKIEYNKEIEDAINKGTYIGTSGLDRQKLRDIETRTDDEANRLWNEYMKTSLKKQREIKRENKKLERRNKKDEKRIYKVLNPLIAKHIRINQQIANLESEQAIVEEEIQNTKRQISEARTLDGKNFYRNKLLVQQRKIQQISERIGKLTSERNHIADNIESLTEETENLADCCELYRRQIEIFNRASTKEIENESKEVEPEAKSEAGTNAKSNEKPEPKQNTESNKKPEKKPKPEQNTKSEVKPENKSEDTTEGKPLTKKQEKEIRRIIEGKEHFSDKVKRGAITVGKAIGIVTIKGAKIVWRNVKRIFTLIGLGANKLGRVTNKGLLTAGKTIQGKLEKDEVTYEERVNRFREGLLPKEQNQITREELAMANSKEGNKELETSNEERE